MATFFEPDGELAAGGGFAAALEAGHEDDRGRAGGELEARGVFAEEVDELVANDFDDLLGGREGGEDFLADGLDADLLDEVFGDVEVDVGFEEGHADFAQGFGDVLFGEHTLAPEVLEGALQFVCQILKHGQFKCIAGGRWNGDGGGCGYSPVPRCEGPVAPGGGCGLSPVPKCEGPVAPGVWVWGKLGGVGWIAQTGRGAGVDD